MTSDSAGASSKYSKSHPPPATAAARYSNIKTDKNIQEIEYSNTRSLAGGPYYACMHDAISKMHICDH